jgi:CRISPR-associated exonuclease Cas4
MEGVDVVYELYNFLREEREKHQKEPGTVWVTDLVSCSLKSKYTSLYPDLVASEVFNPPTIVGALIHRGLEELLKNIFEAKQYKVEIEPETSMELELPSGKVVLKGRADMILTSPQGARIGVEIKSMRGDMPTPLEHHVDQVKFYNYMFGLEKTVLVYVSPDRVTQYEVCEKASQEEIVKRLLEPVSPRYPWECKYCPFSVLCPNKSIK